MADEQGDPRVAFLPPLEPVVQGIGDALRNAVIRETGCIDFTFSAADAVHVGTPPLMPADVVGHSLVPLVQALYHDNDFDPDNDLDAVWREVTSIFHSAPARHRHRLVVNALSTAYSYHYSHCSTPQEAVACFLLLASWHIGRLKVEPDRVVLRTATDSYAIEAFAIEHNRERRRLNLVAPPRLSDALTWSYWPGVTLKPATAATYRFLLNALPTQRVGIHHLFNLLPRLDGWAEKLIVSSFFAQRAEDPPEPTPGPWQEALRIVDQAQSCPVKALTMLLSTVMRREDVQRALGARQPNPKATYTSYLRAKHRAAVLQLETLFRRGQTNGNADVQGLVELQQLIAGR
jgi:hypothetical protein